MFNQFNQNDGGPQEYGVGPGSFMHQMFGRGPLGRSPGMQPLGPSPVAAAPQASPFVPAPPLPTGGNPNALTSLYGHPTMTLGAGAPAPTQPQPGQAPLGTVGTRRVV